MGGLNLRFARIVTDTSGLAMDAWQTRGINMDLICVNVWNLLFKTQEVTSFLLLPFLENSLSARSWRTLWTNCSERTAWNVGERPFKASSEIMVVISDVFRNTELCAWTSTCGLSFTKSIYGFSEVLKSEPIMSLSFSSIGCGRKFLCFGLWLP